MKGSVYTFASDLHDETYERVLDNVQHRAGLQGVGIALSYHHSRDLFPHNPLHKIRYLEGEVFFQPDEKLYARTKMRPVVSPLVAERDPLKTLTTEAERRGLAVRGWTNNMHNSNLGALYPDCLTQNVFGDPIITCLCPANPDVRAYVAAMSANIAQYPIQQLQLESVCYMPYDHGYHHERTLLPLTGAQRYLMSLCFCPHCLSAARAAGVSVEHLQSFVRGELEKVLSGDPSATDGLDVNEAQIGALIGGEVGQFIAVRRSIITLLIGEIVESVKKVRNLPVSVMEWSGGLRAGSGMPVTGAASSAPVRAWQDGVDISAIAKLVDGIGVLGYTNDLQLLRGDMAAYRALLPAGFSLSVALRPMLPDCRSAEDVTQQLRAVSEVQPEWVDYYHYGMMRLTSLDWIKQALAAV